MKRVVVSLAFFALSIVGCKNESPQAEPTPSPSPSPSPSSAPAAAAPAKYVRTARDCAAIVAGLNGGLSKEQITPGSWGNAPKELQVLPPGGELCGAGTVVKSPVIRSALFGDELGAFYKPIAEAMGCTWGGVALNEMGDRKTTQVKFKCPSKPGGGSSMVHTDSGSEFYYVSY